MSKYENHYKVELTAPEKKAVWKAAKKREKAHPDYKLKPRFSKKEIKQSRKQFHKDIMLGAFDAAEELRNCIEGIFQDGPLLADCEYARGYYRAIITSARDRVSEKLLRLLYALIIEAEAVQGASAKESSTKALESA